ncbi:hypothetical protein N9772_01485 [Bacteroidia bacterium]|jgi:hypothetical protein|nr:hypothetical protein [Bacteroidia bacterium]
MSRDSIHQRIDELLDLLSINNSRLSLHSEKLSRLDIDVLRKQCIDLYEEINKLALQGKIKLKASSTSVANEVPIIERELESASVPTPVVGETIEGAQLERKEEVKKPLVRHMVKADDEMLSLFEKFSSEPIKSIAKGMSVAKRFEFQSAFFDGDHKAYNSFMNQLEGAGDRESAFAVYHKYKAKLVWDDEDLKDELKALMYRKYA